MRLALFVLASVLIFGLLQSQIDDLELIDVTPYFFVAICLQLLPFFVRRQADPFEPACLLGVLNLLALVPALTSFLVQRGLSISLLPYVTGRTRIQLVQTVLIAYSLGSVGYFAGYYVSLGKRFVSRFPNIAGGTWRRPRLLAVTAFCAMLFVPAYIYFQARVGASLTDVTQLAAGKAVWRDDPTMSWLMRSVSLGFVPLLLFVGLNFERFTWRRAILTGIAFFIVSVLVTRLGQRGTAIYLGLSALIVIHYLWRRIPISVFLAMAFVAVVVTNVLGAYRSNRVQSTASRPGPRANFNAAEALVEHDDDRLRFAAMAVVFHHFPDRRDYLMGESWAGLAAMFIPRWVWPEKSKAFIWRDTNVVPELVGAPVPITYLALLYANFSWIGIVFGMGMLGVFQRALYEWLLKHQKDKSVAVVYSLAVMYLVPTLIQLSAAIGFLLPAYLSIWYIRKKPALAGRRVAQGGIIAARPIASLQKAPESAAE